MSSSVSQDNCFRCPNCGAENFDFASFCNSCGMSVTEEVSASNSEADSPSHPQTKPGTEGSRGLSFMRAQGSLQGRWEFCIGILVLFFITGYVLNDWQQSNARSEAYRNGLAATEGRDWDRAVASFERAGDYLTSQQRAEEARRKVVERDLLYTEGLQATARQDWRSSIAPLQRLQEVQPAFRDSAALLAQAKSNILNDGLAGIVYLVDDGLSPGLYTRGEQGVSTLLPGSDRNSVVRAISSDGSSVVYDRPSTEIDYTWDSTRNHDAGLQGPFGQGMPERIPVLARLDGVMTTLPLPQLDKNGTGIFDEKGLWWYSSQTSSGPFGFEVSYWSQYFPSGAYAVRVSDLANGKRVIAVDPPRSRVVIAEARGDARGGDRETKLYLAGATGDNRQLLTSTPGEIYQASFSRDGEWLLYLSQQNGVPRITRTASALHLDKSALTDGGMPAAWTLCSLSWSGIEMDTRLSASFVPTRDGNTKVIVNHVEYGTEHMLIYDLDAETVDVLSRESADGAYRRDVSAYSHGGAYLASRRQQAGGAIILVVGLDLHSESWSSAPFPVSNSQIVKTQFAPLDDYVVVAIQNEEGINRGHTQRIYSLHKVDEQSQAGARMIAEADWPYNTDIPTIAMPANGSMLAYINSQRELRAVFYDGTSDTLVSGNVKAVWSLNGRNLSWWR